MGGFTARGANILQGEGLRQGLPFLGLAFYWAWVSVVFYSRALVPAAPDASPGLENSFVDAVWLWATWSHMLGLIFVVILRRRLVPLFWKAPFQEVGAATVALGTLLIPLESTILGLDSPLCQPVALATAVPMGLGSAWLVLQWAHIYGSTLRPSLVAVATTLSFALGLAGYFVLLAFPPYIGTIMAALMPLLSLGTMTVCHERTHGEGAETANAASAARVDDTPCPTKATADAPRPDATRSPVTALLVPLASVFVFALCGEMLRAFALSLAGASVNNMGMLYLVGGLAGLALLSAYLLVPLKGASTPNSGQAAAADGAGQSPTLEDPCAPADADTPRPRQFTIPFLRGVFLLMAAAFLIAPFLAPSALAVSYGIFGVGFWCFRAITWAMCFPLCRAQRLSPLVAVGVLDAAYASSVVVGSTLNRWLTEALKVGATELTTVSLVAVFALMFLALFVLNGPHARAILAPDGDIAPGDDGRTLASSGPGSAATPENAASPGAIPEATDSGSASRSIERLAAAYGLTPREAEVAALLAKGRSLPFVQEELYISLSTAQTHARHIYKKLGVHSRQELIDLVEQAAREATGPVDGIPRP